MKLEVSLNVKNYELFDLIVNSLIYDIQSHCGKLVEKKELSRGYMYQKLLTNKLGKKSYVSACILELNAPTDYSIQFEKNNQINIISYHIEDSVDHIIVRYSEDYKTTKRSLEINHKFMSVFYNKSNKKKILKMLYSMEEYILSQRK